MKPYNERTKVGKLLARIFGYADNTLEPAEVVVKVIDILKRIAENPHVTAYALTSKSKLPAAVLRALKTWLLPLAAQMQIHAQRSDDWQEGVQLIGQALRAYHPEVRKNSTLPRMAGMAYQAELESRGEPAPSLDVAKAIVQPIYEAMKANKEVS